MATHKNIQNKALEVSKLLISNGYQLGTAESCTGGLISAFCTDISGSSQWFYATVVSYNNQAKIDLLKVKASTIEKHGAVSENTVKEMCEGLLDIIPVDYVISVSGVAGPTGGTKINPVGTVWIGVQKRNEKSLIKKYIFSGDRENIRYNTVLKAFENLEQLIKG